jgi:hypothetical protein
LCLSDFFTIARIFNVNPNRAAAAKIPDTINGSNGEFQHPSLTVRRISSAANVIGKNLICDLEFLFPGLARERSHKFAKDV